VNSATNCRPCVCVCYINLSRAVTTDKLFGVTSVAFCLHFPSFLAMEILIERRRGKSLTAAVCRSLGGGWYKNHALISKTFFPCLMAFCFRCTTVHQFQIWVYFLWKISDSAIHGEPRACELREYYFLKTACASHVVATPDLRPIVQKT